jgi:hypothetical protein
VSAAPAVTVQPDDELPGEAPARVPPIVLVLARLLVARALEDEGVIAPANDNLCPPR